MVAKTARRREKWAHKRDHRETAMQETATAKALTAKARKILKDWTRSRFRV